MVTVTVSELISGPACPERRFFHVLERANGSVSTAAAGMAEVPGTSSETITETVQTGTPPPPQQVTHHEEGQPSEMLPLFINECQDER